MTDDELELALRESLEARATVRDEDIRPLREFIKALPPRRRRRGGAVLAAAAGVVVMLGIGGLLVANLPLGSGGAAPGPPDPAAFALDPRLAVCGLTATDAEAIFELEYVRDYPLHLPAAYKLIGLDADPEAPALVIVRSGPASGDREGNSPGAGNHDLCMVVGADKASWARVDIVDVDTTGLIGVLPEPTGTPFADALAPWAERCGGVDARILEVYTFDHGGDAAASLALDPQPPELETDKPGAVIVYAGAHPFPPLGTPPADGVTFAPREPLGPDRHDLCVLIGADPATAKRTIHEDVGVAALPGPTLAGSTQSASPIVAPSPTSVASDAVVPWPEAIPLPRTFSLVASDSCEAFGVEDPVIGVMRGDSGDPELVWLEAPNGKRLTIVWPAGFAVAFRPNPVLVQADGHKVANEGDTIVLQVSRAAAAGTRADPYVAAGIMLAGKHLSLDKLGAAKFQGCFIPG